MSLRQFEKMKGYVFVLLCASVSSATGQSFEKATEKIASEVMKDCSSSEDLFFCLKKKVVTLMDKVNRFTIIPISENVKIVRFVNSSGKSDELTEMKLEAILSRSTEARSNALSEILNRQVTDFLQSATIEIDFSGHGRVEDSNDELTAGKGI